MRLSPESILRELVAIPTPSGISNLPFLNWIAGKLEPIGWEVRLLPYQDIAGIFKANLIARPVSCADRDQIDLAFVCHTDTVPYAADWINALSLVECKGRLHGCGSCDVKGALACFLAAVFHIPQDRIDSGVALILTADEEIGCQGMERLLASTALRIASAIVSEPTSLRPGIAGKGYGLAKITVQGKEAHSAFPNQGVSAISIAARLVSSIEDRFAPVLTDALFDPPRTTLNIGLIEGGTAKNIIPGSCTFLVEWRGIPGEDPSSLVAQIEELVAQAHRGEQGTSIKLEILRSEPGFSPKSSGPLQQRLAKLISQTPVGISFGSEASRLSRIAEEVIVIGPGDMQTAHSNRECVPVAELENWTSILKILLQK